MPLATTKGKEHALAELEKRREKNKDRKKIRNEDLYAGSPMYYYCRSCSEEMVLPETHTCPAPELCEECKSLEEKGWMACEA